MQDEQGIAVMQWLPASLQANIGDSSIGLTIRQDGQHGLYPLNTWNVEGMKTITEVHVPSIPEHRPDRFIYEISVEASKETTFRLSIRLPWWVSGEATIAINGVPLKGEWRASSFAEINRTWMDGDRIRVEFPKSLTAETLPGEPGTVAFMDGPIVLAGLVDEERRLHGDPNQPETLLVSDRERNHSWWNTGFYRTRGQDRGFRFIPLYEIKDQKYTVYFPVE